MKNSVGKVASLFTVLSVMQRPNLEGDTGLLPLCQESNYCYINPVQNPLI